MRWSPDWVMREASTFTPYSRVQAGESVQMSVANTSPRVSSTRAFDTASGTGTGAPPRGWFTMSRVVSR